jgi:hypothetical protein
VSTGSGVDESTAGTAAESRASGAGTSDIASTVNLQR